MQNPPAPASRSFLRRKNERPINYYLPSFSFQKIVHFLFLQNSAVVTT